MNKDIQIRIEELDAIWSRIIEADDEIIALNDDLKEAVQNNIWKQAYVIQNQIHALNIKKRNLMMESDVYERIIMSMLLE